MAHAQAPISNISELNSLGATTSITLPKKRYWKQVVIGAAVALSLVSNVYYISTLDIVKSFLGSEATSGDETLVDQAVPIAPNPEIMPTEMNTAIEAPPPVMVENPIVTAPAVPKSKLAPAKAKVTKKAILKQKFKGKDVSAQKAKKPVKAAMKAKKAKIKPTQKVVSQASN